MRNKSIDNSAQNNLVIHNYGHEEKKGSLKIIGTGNTTSMMKVQTGLNYILGNTPTSNIDTQFLTMDSTGNWTGIFSNTAYQNGSVAQTMACRKQDKSTSAAIQVGFDANGNDYFNASNGVKRSIVNWGMPDYTAQYSAVNNQMYTLNYNCIVSIHNDNSYLYIYDKNGTNVYTGSCLNLYAQVHQYIVPAGYSFKCNQYGTIIPLNV